MVAAIAEKAGLSKADAAKALKATTEAITEALSKGDEISLIDFGTFKRKARAARTGKKPRTGEAIEAPVATVPTFKEGRPLKDKVNG